MCSIKWTNYITVQTRDVRIANLIWSLKNLNLVVVTTLMSYDAVYIPLKCYCKVAIKK